MSKPSALEKAEAAKANAEAREANARAKSIEANNDLAIGLKALFEDVATSIERNERRNERKERNERLGQQKELRRFGHGGILPKILPSMIDPFLVKNGGKKIPDEFWAIDNDEAMVSCPCGNEPRIALGSIHICEGEDCGRVFFFVGREVRVTTLSDEAKAALHSPADE